MGFLLYAYPFCILRNFYLNNHAIKERAPCWKQNDIVIITNILRKRKHSPLSEVIHNFCRCSHVPLGIPCPRYQHRTNTLNHTFRWTRCRIFVKSELSVLYLIYIYIYIYIYKRYSKCSSMQVFIYCKFTLHVSGAHHQEYIKLLPQPLVQVIVTVQRPSSNVA